MISSRLRPEELRKRRRNASKGQYLILEEVVIFLMGVIIVLGSITTFQTFGSGLEDRTSFQEMSSVGEKVVSLAVELTASGTRASTRFNPPQKIAGQSYVIDLVDGRGAVIRLSGGEREVTVPLRGLEHSIELNGSVSSEIDKPRLTFNRDPDPGVLQLGW